MRLLRPGGDPVLECPLKRPGSPVCPSGRERPLAEPVSDGLQSLFEMGTLCRPPRCPNPLAQGVGRRQQMGRVLIFASCMSDRPEAEERPGDSSLIPVPDEPIQCLVEPGGRLLPGALDRRDEANLVECP